MKPICDRYTGKPVDYPSDLLSSLNGQKCDECGSECIDRCPMCLAPQCCPVCCRGPCQPDGSARCAVATGSPSDTPETDRWEYEQECNFDVPWEDYCRKLEREMNEWKSIAKEALMSFRCTQRPEMYPEGHWSRRAVILLDNPAKSQ